MYVDIYICIYVCLHVCVSVCVCVCVCVCECMRVNKSVCECIVRLTSKAGSHLRIESIQFKAPPATFGQ